MNEICFASIDPLALRALPLEGEEIPATKCNYSRRLYFSPLPGEMPRSGRGVNAFLSTLVNDSVYLDFVITVCR